MSSDEAALREARVSDLRNFSHEDEEALKEFLQVLDTLSLERYLLLTQP